jgi:D-beta-D-heptose 7-phosphate kinase/D-beta-D-heptose 1-phosphate adenosyltransferase
MILNRAGAERLIAGFKNTGILVVGDLMLDRYIFGSVSRISPEAPVPVVHVVSEESRPGGASNVSLNIASLGGSSMVAGIAGADKAGEDLLNALTASGIETGGVVCARSIQTTVKTRIVADRQQVARVDHEDGIELYADRIDELCSMIPGLVEKSTAVIIEDYGKGVICQEVVDAVLSAAKEQGKPVGFDPKDNHKLEIPWLTLATPNYREACLATGQPELPLGQSPETSEGLASAANRLSEQWDSEFLMITLGPHGMYLCPRDGSPSVQPTLAKEVFDVSGAGDTVIAVAMMAVSAGAGYEEAASLANHAAGVVVGKVGTATCTPDELLDSFKS